MDTQNLLQNIAQMPLPELEALAKQLDSLIVRKRTSDVAAREVLLLGKINKTILEKSKRERYQTLIQTHEIGNLTPAEEQELMKLTEEEEKIRAKRLKYLVELAQLRNMSVPQLMKNLELATSLINV